MMASQMAGHSTHHVSINLVAGVSGTALLGVEYWASIVAITATAVISLGLMVYFQKRKTQHPR
jgi:hypothetical protein